MMMMMMMMIMMIQIQYKSPNRSTLSQNKKQRSEISLDCAINGSYQKAMRWNVCRWMFVLDFIIYDC